MTERIKTARLSAHLKQYEVAELINVSRSFYSRVENGIERPSERTLKDIARVTNTNYHWLKTGEGDMQAPSLDEDATIISELLEHGRDNPMYDAILDIVKIYRDLTPTDKLVIDSLIKQFRNI